MTSRTPCPYIPRASGQTATAEAGMKGFAVLSLLWLLAAGGRAQTAGSTLVAPFRTGLDTLRNNVQTGLMQAREKLGVSLQSLGSQATGGLAAASDQVVQLIGAKQAAAGQVVAGLGSALSGTPLGASLGPGLRAVTQTVGGLGGAAQSAVGSKARALQAVLGQGAAAAQRGAGVLLDGVQFAGGLALQLAGQKLDLAQAGIDTALNLANSLSGSPSRPPTT